MMIDTLKRILVGRPLDTAAQEHQRLRKLIALAVFASDPISSNAYATEAIMLVLLTAGVTTLNLNIPICIAIITLLLIVGFSYRQTIHAYPSGGGAYIVAHENLGEIAWPGRGGLAADRLCPDRGGLGLGRRLRDHLARHNLGLPAVWPTTASRSALAVSR